MEIQPLRARPLMDRPLIAQRNHGLLDIANQRLRPAHHHRALAQSLLQRLADDIAALRAAADHRNPRVQHRLHGDGRAGRQRGLRPSGGGGTTGAGAGGRDVIFTLDRRLAAAFAVRAVCAWLRRLRGRGRG